MASAHELNFQKLAKKMFLLSYTVRSMSSVDGNIRYSVWFTEIHGQLVAEYKLMDMEIISFLHVSVFDWLLRGRISWQAAISLTTEVLRWCHTCDDACIPVSEGIHILRFFSFKNMTRSFLK